jgi:DNA-binding GntR family transcriptional regulator
MPSPTPDTRTPLPLSFDGRFGLTTRVTSLNFVSNRHFWQLPAAGTDRRRRRNHRMHSRNKVSPRPPPRYERVRGIVEASIRKGMIEQGTVLLEGPLADLFGSSRAPVRQALQRLHRQGILSRFDGRGFLVGPSSAPVRRVELSANMLDLPCEKRPLRPSFDWERIYDAVEREIVHRSVFGRFRVNELELARVFGVGRSVARDVLTRLQGIGIVDKDDRQRWAIVPLDSRRLADLYEIREQLEPLALRHTLPLLARRQLIQMRSRAADALAAYPAVTSTAMDALEHDLHVRCLAACPNRELLAALQRTRCVLTVSKHVLGVAMPLPAAEPFMAEHLDVIDAMIAGKAKAAGRALLRHLRASRPKVTERLDAFRAAFTPPDSGYIA